MYSLIIYPNDFGGVAFCYPCECGLSIEEIARKDVPTGKPYHIVTGEQVPKDHMFFDAFEADFSDPDGYGIGPQAWFIEQYQIEIARINSEPSPIRTEEQTEDDYTLFMSKWEEFKTSRIEQLNKQIVTQQLEMQA